MCEEAAGWLHGVCGVGGERAGATPMSRSRASAACHPSKSVWFSLGLGLGLG